MYYCGWLKQVQRKNSELQTRQRVKHLGLKDDRRAILPAGFAIIQAVFDELDLQTL
jgi:exopolyphosphatase/pppGpp-phosphohydrolase